jgi:hypothetical protein
MSYRPTLAEAMHDLVRLVADGKCDKGTAVGCAAAELVYEGYLRGVCFARVPKTGMTDFVSVLYVAAGHGRRSLRLAADLMAEIGERLLESAAPVGHAPRREEGGEGSRFGGDGETVPEGEREVKGCDDE